MLIGNDGPQQRRAGRWGYPQTPVKRNNVHNECITKNKNKKDIAPKRWMQRVTKQLLYKRTYKGGAVKWSLHFLQLYKDCTILSYVYTDCIYVRSESIRLVSTLYYTVCAYQGSACDSTSTKEPHRTAQHKDSQSLCNCVFIYIFHIYLRLC